MLHSLKHVGDHQNPLAGTPTLVSCQAPQLGRPRFAAEKVCRHPPSPKHSTLAYQLYHIWGSPEAGITPDLSGANLRRANLSEADVSGANLSNVISRWNTRAPYGRFFENRPTNGCCRGSAVVE